MNNVTLSEDEARMRATAVMEWLRGADCYQVDDSPLLHSFIDIADEFSMELDGAWVRFSYYNENDAEFAHVFTGRALANSVIRNGSLLACEVDAPLEEAPCVIVTYKLTKTQPGCGKWLKEETHNLPTKTGNNTEHECSSELHCSAFVERSNYLGREYLRVGGVVLGFEGDICRDFAMAGRVWTGATLDEAAARITAATKGTQ